MTCTQTPLFLAISFYFGDFLSAATLVAADYGSILPPRFMFVCLCVCWDGRKLQFLSNFSAVRSPIELKLGNLGLVFQISMHVLVSRFDYFLYCKQTKERENHQNREKRSFTKLAFSPLFQVRLI
jgi:hypothetical protein